jgi:hypothetical protein
MDQKSIVRYLVRKRFTSLAISRDLKATLEEEVVEYQSVVPYLREARCALPNSPKTVSEPEPQLNDSDNAILLALAR